MKFKTVCYLLVQLMHCRKMFKAEIPFSNVMTCEDDDKVIHASLVLVPGLHQAHVLWEPMGWSDQLIEEFLVFLLELPLSHAYSLLKIKTKIDYNRPQIWISSWTSQHSWPMWLPLRACLTGIRVSEAFSTITKSCSFASWVYHSLKLMATNAK